jgi:hypothetical protein
MTDYSPPVIQQEADGTWTATIKDGDRAIQSDGWASEEQARLVAYQMKNPTPLRSHRVGGGYR